MASALHQGHCRDAPWYRALAPLSEVEKTQGSPGRPLTQIGASRRSLHPRRLGPRRRSAEEPHPPSALCLPRKRRRTGGAWAAQLRHGWLQGASAWRRTTADAPDSGVTMLRAAAHRSSALCRACHARSTRTRHGPAFFMCNMRKALRHVAVRQPTSELHASFLDTYSMEDTFSMTPGARPTAHFDRAGAATVRGKA